jgi:hypothetical protein
MVDRGVARSGGVRHDPEQVEVVPQPVARQQQRPVRVELHGDDGLKKRSGSSGKSEATLISKTILLHRNARQF